MLKLSRDSNGNPQQNMISFHINNLVAMAEAGRFGTPDNPDRSNSGRRVFWLCYFGHRKPSEYRNTVSYPNAKAGQIYKQKD